MLKLSTIRVAQTGTVYWYSFMEQIDKENHTYYGFIDLFFLLSLTF